MHLKNIFVSGELERGSTASKMETVQQEGGRRVDRQIDHFNPDAMISSGYRVDSARATRFRQWATRIPARSRKEESMKPISPRWAVMIAVLFLLASCGDGGGGSKQSVCTPTENMMLQDRGGELLSNITVTIMQGFAVTPVPVYVAYAIPPVAAIAAGYPPGAEDPRTVGIDIVPAGSPSDNPIEFDLTFDSSLAKATYSATWRFVAVDPGANMAGCQDLPVTFTIE